MNKKTLFLVITLTTMLILVTSVNAATDNTNTSTTHSISEKTTTAEPVVKEKIKNTQTKQITKTNKTQENTKTATQTVTVNNYNELMTTINSAVNDLDNDEYIINLNAGTYNQPVVSLSAGRKTPNIIINGNGQTLSGRRLMINNYCNITINDITLNQDMQNGQNNITFKNTIIKSSITNDKSLTLINSTLENTIQNNGKIIIDNDTTFTNQAFINGNGEVIADDPNKILPYISTYNGDYVFENTTIDSIKTNNGNLTIINSTLPRGIINNGKLILKNSSCFYIMANGLVYIYDSNITSNMYANGNVTIVNSTINQINGNTNSNITTINSTLDNENIINRNSTLILSDDTIFGDNFSISLQYGGKVIYNDSYKIAQYLSAYYDDYTLENITISTPKTNNANLTIKNSTINTSIANYGNLIICDDVIFTDIASISGYGQIITNDTTKIIPYLSTYDGNYILENIVISTAKTNNGNITIKNSTINSTITNNGNMTINDDVIFGENTLIRGNGQIIINDSTRITPYINTYIGENTLKNVNIIIPKTNQGTLIIKNSTLNSTITNNGTLIICDDCILGENLQIIAQENHNIITNISNITNYITQYQGNHTITNTNLVTSIYLLDGNLTIKNSNISSMINVIGYNSKLIIEGSSIDNTLYVSGTSEVIISDDTTLKENFEIYGSGKVIANASNNERYPYFTTFSDGILNNLDIDKQIWCTNMTIINSTSEVGLVLTNSSLINSTVNGWMNSLTDSTSINSEINGIISNNGKSSIINSTLNGILINEGILVIDDNSIFGDEFKIEMLGEIIINDTNRLAPYISIYYGNVTIENQVINEDKTNNGNLTLINSTVKSNIINNGILTIDQNTIFEDNVKISGNGVIITDNIYRILHYITTIHGNYTIKDTILNKPYNFIGNITIDNSTITAGFNENYGLLTITNSEINVPEKYDYWIENNNVLILDDSNNIINGKIINNGYVYDSLPDDYNSKIHIVNNKTLDLYFKGGLTDLVQPGDTLDFQGTITRSKRYSLTIDKPVNIITTTNDGRIESIGEMKYVEGGSGSNVTGITLFNTQFTVSHANHIVFDNISNIVDNDRIGTGRGQTSIGGNSSYITIKNSYIYTRKNGGSSSLVLAWADYCDIINNTIVGGGENGNLIYFTTYGVDPEIIGKVIVNHDNKVLNNTIIGPSEEAGICIGFVLTGTNNLFDGNTINYTGGGVAAQWGSGVIDDYSEDSETITGNNTISNNYLYGGCGISGADIIYNNYVELGTITVMNATIYNNTAYNLEIREGKNNITNNTILNTLSTTTGNINETIITNNNIKNINIARNTGNLTFTNNNITGTVNINGTNNVFTENNITSTSDYAFIGRGTNNTITHNHITSAFNGGDASVNLNQERNTIKDNTPISTIIGITDDLRINIYETETITFNITNSNNEIINKGNIIIKDETGNTLLEQTVNGEEINLDLYYEEQGAIMLTAQYTDETGEHLNATKTIRVVKLVPPTQTQISDETPVLGESTELTATFFQADGTPVNGGKAIFRVNGKTLRDDQGNVIYADVINGHVQPLTVNITNEWMKPDTTIQAIYSGTDEFEPIITQPTKVTIAQPEATITLDAPTEATAGTTITLKATVTDDDIAVNSGRVAFKLNGKTLKNADGKALYAEVKDGVATIQYTIPEKTKAKTYNLTAVFTDTAYDRKEASAELVVAKA